VPTAHHDKTYVYVQKKIKAGSEAQNENEEVP